MSNKIKLSAADQRAISHGDSMFINNKGAALYCDSTFDQAVEYYRLASAMGDTHATSNLGYCYLYGRSIEPNLSLAIAYFQIAVQAGDIDAAYKLGDIYSGEKWGVKDTELSVYYYQIAANRIIDDDTEDIFMYHDLQQYPSLCFALGREHARNGSLITDINRAYQFLLHAKAGYEAELRNGRTMYEQSYQSVLQWLEDPQFDFARKFYDSLFDFEEDEE